MTGTVQSSVNSTAPTHTAARTSGRRRSASAENCRSSTHVNTNTSQSSAVLARTRFSVSP